MLLILFRPGLVHIGCNQFIPPVIKSRVTWIISVWRQRSNVKARSCFPVPLCQPVAGGWCPLASLTAFGHLNIIKGKPRYIGKAPIEFWSRDPRYRLVLVRFCHIHSFVRDYREFVMLNDFLLWGALTVMGFVLIQVSSISFCLSQLCQVCTIYGMDRNTHKETLTNNAPKTKRIVRR